MTMPTSTPDDFWAKVVANYFAEMTAKAGAKVGKTLADLWPRVNATSKQPKDTAQAQTALNAPPLLPQTLMPLVGREADFASVIGALSNNRLLTITGLGGVGKTALAQTVARWMWETEHETSKKNSRGVPYIALDALSNGKELADYVRRKLLPDSIPPADADERERQEDAVRLIANALNQEARLLVLDNFESALDDAGAPMSLDFIRNLIAATESSGLRVLVTSKRAMDLIPLEVEYPLDPLEAKYALDLFYERAGDAVNPSDREVVAEICKLEDYLPLGIELAAAAIQQKRRPLKEMLEALRVTPLDVDIADALGYPERQRGLIATFRYTFEHLSKEAQRLFCAFSVFRGGADRDAVKNVDGTATWEKAVGDLVSWKLLNVDTTREPWRYSILATTQAFSQLQMEKIGGSLGLNRSALEKHHASYYIPIVAGLKDGPRAYWYPYIQDLDNMNVAIDRTILRFAEVLVSIDARDEAKAYLAKILRGYEEPGANDFVTRVRAWMKKNRLDEN